MSWQASRTVLSTFSWRNRAGRNERPPQKGGGSSIDSCFRLSTQSRRGRVRFICCLPHDHQPPRAKRPSSLLLTRDTSNLFRLAGGGGGHRGQAQRAKPMGTNTAVAAFRFSSNSHLERLVPMPAPAARHDSRRVRHHVRDDNASASASSSSAAATTTIPGGGHLSQEPHRLLPWPALLADVDDGVVRDHVGRYARPPRPPPRRRRRVAPRLRRRRRGGRVSHLSEELEGEVPAAALPAGNDGRVIADSVDFIPGTGRGRSITKLELVEHDTQGAVAAIRNWSYDIPSLRNAWKKRGSCWLIPFCRQQCSACERFISIITVAPLSCVIVVVDSACQPDGSYLHLHLGAKSAPYPDGVCSKNYSATQARKHIRSNGKWRGFPVLFLLFSLLS